MWLQLQTDLKEAIESVWTVMGYPEHCRGARCRNEMHLFVFPLTTPPTPPPPPREDDWAVRLLTAPALSIYSGALATHTGALLVVLEVSGSLTNPKIRIMICSQMRQAGI